MLSGVDNPEDALNLCNSLCKDTGLLLLKFRSNCLELLALIPEELQEKSSDLNIYLDPTFYGKNLGVHYNTQTD